MFIHWHGKMDCVYRNSMLLFKNVFQACNLRLILLLDLNMHHVGFKDWLSVLLVNVLIGWSQLFFAHSIYLHQFLRNVVSACLPDSKTLQGLSCKVCTPKITRRTNKTPGYCTKLTPCNHWAYKYCYQILNSQSFFTSIIEL